MKITDKRIRCCDCGRYFEPGNREDGIPNGIGFVLEDGTVINVCSDCIMKAGLLKSDERIGKLKAGEE